MRYFLDTEFIETVGHIQLISIGIVAEDGRELYLVNYAADLSNASEWVKVNVLSKISHYDYESNSFLWMTMTHPDWNDIFNIRNAVLAFTGQYPTRSGTEEECEFWGYYADYDWVVFCWIFGTMMELPKGYPMFCHDIMQLIEDTGVDKAELLERIPQTDQHSALADAKWNKAAFDLLIAYDTFSQENMQQLTLKEYCNSSFYNPFGYKSPSKRSLNNKGDFDY
jgi:3'-5' exoribonuclease Rv2179c-like domain